MKPIFLTALSTILLGATVASADGTTVVQAPPQQPTQAVVVPPARERVESHAYYPNVPLIVTGGVLFLGTYIPSLVVAGESSDDADRRLAVPIVGPWLDIAERGGCPVASRNCDDETTNKVLLVGDGVLQAVGTIAFVTGFLTPGRAATTETTATKAKIRFTPMQLGRGASMGAGFVGTF